jgi:hypothetical protein
MYEGVDTSFWNGNFTPSAPATFNIINASRANNGGLGVGSQYHTQVDNARSVGCEVGHYFFNGNIDVAACARFFVANLYDFRKGRDVIVLDSEAEPSTGTRAWTPSQVLLWAQIVTQLLGIPMSTVGVYLNRSLMTGYDWSAVVAAGIWLWIAYPGSNPGSISYWPDWTMWQYTSAGGLDRNKSKKTLAQIAGGSGALPDQEEEQDMRYINCPDRGSALVSETGFYMYTADIYGPTQTESRVAAAKLFQGIDVTAREWDIIRQDRLNLAAAKAAEEKPAPAVDTDAIVAAIEAAVKDTLSKMDINVDVDNSEVVNAINAIPSASLEYLKSKI